MKPKQPIATDRQVEIAKRVFAEMNSRPLTDASKIGVIAQALADESEFTWGECLEAHR